MVPAAMRRSPRLATRGIAARTDDVLEAMEKIGLLEDVYVFVFAFHVVLFPHNLLHKGGIGGEPHVEVVIVFEGVLLFFKAEFKAVDNFLIGNALADRHFAEEGEIDDESEAEQSGDGDVAAEPRFSRVRIVGRRYSGVLFGGGSFGLLRQVVGQRQLR